MRREYRLERSQRAAGSQQDAASDWLIILLAQVCDKVAETLGSEAPRGLNALLDEFFCLLQFHLGGRVIRLRRAWNGPIQQIDSAAIDDVGRTRRAGDCHHRGPSGMRAKSERN